MFTEKTKSSWMRIYPLYPAHLPEKVLAAKPNNALWKSFNDIAWSDLNKNKESKKHKE